jgi:hypothetical protein
VQILPFSPGVSPYRVATSLGDVSYVFELRWNSRDECWYLDAYEEDGVTAIFHGAKIVLGAHIGRVHRHPLVTNSALIAIDTAARGDPAKMRDATFYDLGTRVLVIFATAVELIAAARAEQAA